MAAPQISGHKFSGAHGKRTIDPSHMAVWSLIFAVLAVPTVTIAVGYLFGSLSIIFAAIVIGRRTTGEAGEGALIGACVGASASAIAMLGYLVYMIAVSPNYMEL